jgi:aminoglycoside phosphotransferase
VVCHGDACAPNTLIAAEGRWSGHVDLGMLGTADRWARARQGEITKTFLAGKHFISIATKSFPDHG